MNNEKLTAMEPDLYQLHGMSGTLYEFETYRDLLLKRFEQHGYPQCDHDSSKLCNDEMGWIIQWSNNITIPTS